MGARVVVQGATTAGCPYDGRPSSFVKYEMAALPLHSAVRLCLTVSALGSLRLRLRAEA